MNKTEAVLTLVKELNELEITELFEGLEEYLYKNKMSHVSDRLSSFEIDNLKERIEELEDEMKDLEDQKDEADSYEKDTEEKLKAIEAIVTDMDVRNSGMDYLEEQIDKIKNLIE